MAPTAAYLRLVQITSLKQRDYSCPNMESLQVIPMNCWLLAEGKNLQELPAYSSLIHFQPLVTVHTNWTSQNTPGEKQAGPGETSDGIFSLVFYDCVPKFTTILAQVRCEMLPASASNRMSKPHCPLNYHYILIDYSYNYSGFFFSRFKKKGKKRDFNCKHTQTAGAAGLLLLPIFSSLGYPTVPRPPASLRTP